MNALVNGPSVNTQAPILVFERVSVEAEDASEAGVWDASFSLGAGDLLLLRIDPWAPVPPLADIAIGLVEPAEGEVTFQGRPWAGRGVHDAGASRARVGRAFLRDGFVSNLDVDENIILTQRHHTGRSQADLLAEAGELSRVFGLPGLPRGRSWRMRRQDLRRAALVRAFMGDPRLVLLEEPMRELGTEVLPPLINICRRVRARGGAVLWITADRRVWAEPALRASHRMIMSGARILSAG